MKLISILQYATLFSLGIGLLGVGISLLTNRQQLTTHIFLAVFSRYDELLENSSAGFWASLLPETELSEPSEELTMSVFRYYNNAFLMFFCTNGGASRRSYGSSFYLLCDGDCAALLFFESGRSLRGNLNTCRNSQNSFTMFSMMGQ
jgi:hypothetical protein